MHRKRVNCFGSSCQLALVSLRGEAEQIVAIALAELERLESKFSAYHPDSLISRINQAAGTGCYTPLDAEARSLFDFVTVLWEESSHLFDPTVSILDHCYDEHGQLKATDSQLKDMLKLVGWSQLQLTDEGALLPTKGMLLDLTSCIRPYAIDSVRRKLLKEGVQHAMIEMAHDAATIGKQADGANWLLGLRHPMGSRTAINRIKVSGKGFAMRGDFERRIGFRDEHFGRGLSPVDGYPVPGMLSVSVVADSCLDACGAATIARLKTEQAAINWLQKLGLPWMAIDRQLRCHGPLSPA
ncbi:FAD:protein FMN transferase [Seongchinamella sediminis]|nr:FAD:protein FMN transferase [Seongchinamella sediminis]